MSTLFDVIDISRAAHFDSPAPSFSLHISAKITREGCYRHNVGWNNKWPRTRRNRVSTANNAPMVVTPVATTRLRHETLRHAATRRAPARRHEDNTLVDQEQQVVNRPRP